VAGGASGRNGGFALRGAALRYAEARERLGRDAAAELWRKTEAALDRMEPLAGDALRRAGSVRLAVDDSERDALAADAEALVEDGFALEWPPNCVHRCEVASRPRSSIPAAARSSQRAGFDGSQLPLRSSGPRTPSVPDSRHSTSPVRSES
jgi:hypothetical protein